MAKKNIGILQAALRLEAGQFRKELGRSSTALGKFGKKFAPQIAVAAAAIFGMAEATKAFKLMEIEPDSLLGKNGIQQLQEVAIGIRNLNDESKQLSATVKIFDSEGAAMLQWFKDIDFQIIDAIQTMQMLGLAIDQDMYDKSKSFNAELLRLNQGWDVFKM